MDKIVCPHCNKENYDNEIDIRNKLYIESVFRTGNSLLSRDQIQKIYDAMEFTSIYEAVRILDMDKDTIVSYLNGKIPTYENCQKIINVAFEYVDSNVMENII